MGFYVYLLSLFNRNHDKPTSSFMESPSPSGISKVNSCPSASVISRFLSSFASLLSNWTMCLSISPLLRVSPTFFIVLVRRRRCLSETCSLGFWAWGTRWITMGWKKNLYVSGLCHRNKTATKKEEKFDCNETWSENRRVAKMAIAKRA